ncbi:MAG: hypothetical protein AAGA56_10435 [Myxococcota bacterium]
MNADNHASCRSLAASCPGRVVQRESCPLQFACEGGGSTEARGGVGGPDAQDYDPCAGKKCGDACQVCPPDDSDCVETAVMKTCDADGACGATVPACE